MQRDGPAPRRNTGHGWWQRWHISRMYSIMYRSRAVKLPCFELYDIYIVYAFGFNILISVISLSFFFYGTDTCTGVFVLYSKTN